MRRSNQIWEQLGRSQAELEPPAAAYRRLRLQMLSAERSSVLEARDSGTYDDEVLRMALTAIDLEESLLDRVEDAAARIDDELVTPDKRAGDCKHLDEAPRVVRANTPGVCEECVREGTRWVHLRLCLDLRPRRLLRLVGTQARHRALPRDRAPGHAQHRAGRGVALVLRRRPARLSSLSGAECGHLSR